MIAFGGAAPLHASRLCEKLGIDRLIVPPGAGVGSAIGFLRAPASFEANRSVYMRLGAFDADKVAAILAELTEEATGFVRRSAPGAAIETVVKAYMRYTGQGWEIPVTLDPEGRLDAPDFEARFDEDYTRLFGRPVAGLDIEITVWSVNASTIPGAVPPAALAETRDPAESADTSRFFDPALGRYVEGARFARAALPPGALIEGPALITEDETTIVLPVSRKAIRQPDGAIDVTRKD